MLGGGGGGGGLNFGILQRDDMPPLLTPCDNSMAGFKVINQSDLSCKKNMCSSTTTWFILELKHLLEADDNSKTIDNSYIKYSIMTEGM